MRSDLQMRGGHTFATMGEFSFALPLLLISAVLVVIVVFRLYFYETLQAWGFTLSSNEIEVDEDLPNFFEAVKLSDADWMVYENRNLRENYGVSFVSREIEERLDDWKTAKKPIQGVAWYNVLANPVYARAFSYITLDVPNRENLIVDGDEDEGNDCEQSDLCSIMINLAFIQKDKARDFKIEKGFSNFFREDVFQRLDTETREYFNEIEHGQPSARAHED